ncbi:hypothetical protein BASA60_008679 [Batrachochytrium salamandrivorans]|nr:hypothetical protein BASA60_008679 [Batrachochytrium salamandrivorans]
MASAFIPTKTTGSNASVLEPINSLSIPLSEERDSPTKYIAYKTVLKCQAREWVVWRRYSEFDALNKQLSLLFPDAPPLPRQLPGKSFTLASSGLSFFTVDSAKMEARRIALEAYLQAILYSKYAQWRRSEVWLQFLGVSSTLRLPVTTLMDLNDDSNLAGCLAHIASRSSTGSDNQTLDSWMQDFQQLQLLVTNIRTEVNARARSAESSDVSAVQSKNVQLRKATTIAAERLAALNRSLVTASGLASTGDSKARLASGHASKGEIRRRQDLLANLTEETAQVTKAALSTPTVHARSLKESSDRRDLMGVATAAGSVSSHPASSACRSSRKFGVMNTLPQETDETRPLDNSGLLQLQRDTLEQQEAGLDSLATIIRRQREIGLTIGQELDSQNVLLDEVGSSVARVETNLKTSDKKLGRLLNKK